MRRNFVYFQSNEIQEILKQLKSMIMKDREKIIAEMELVVKEN